AVLTSYALRKRVSSWKSPSSHAPGGATFPAASVRRKSPPSLRTSSVFASVCDSQPISSYPRSSLAGTGTSSSGAKKMLPMAPAALGVVRAVAQEAGGSALPSSPATPSATSAAALPFGDAGTGHRAILVSTLSRRRGRAPGRRVGRPSSQAGAAQEAFQPTPSGREHSLTPPERSL